MSGDLTGLEDLAPGARVVVAMSGGVDSSVVAARLKARGLDVVGLTLQLYDHGAATGRKGSCCAGQDIHDARRVADRLGITHYVLDFEAKFRARVMDDFAEAYARGETPVPCVRCNERVKFRDLLDIARELGGAALATGHYARRLPGLHGPELHQAVDGTRDQTYFLFATTEAQLGFLRFPLGHLTKAEVRADAAALGLAIADKPDSQDICFVPDGRYASVVQRLKPGAAEPGLIVDLDGRVLGTHQGIIHYTVGQRRGLGVATGEPLYVLRLDAAARRVVVGPRAALMSCQAKLRGLNLLLAPGEQIRAQSGEGLPLFARVRSTRAPCPAVLRLAGTGFGIVEFSEGEEGVAPGQACVFYAGSAGARVLGGGWITGSIPLLAQTAADPAAVLKVPAALA